MKVESIFDRGMSYTSYRNMLEKLINEGKTTGNSQSETLLEYTKLNIQRMNRLDKTLVIPTDAASQLQSITRPIAWLVVGEAWCGDCAQIIPVLNKLALAGAGKVELRIAIRDEVPEIMEPYHTQSIPKLLIADGKTFEVMHVWGPRPQPAQDIMLKWKNSNGSISKNDFANELHLWYARDKGSAIIHEIINIIKTLTEGRIQSVQSVTI